LKRELIEYLAKKRLTFENGGRRHDFGQSLCTIFLALITQTGTDPSFPTIVVAVQSLGKLNLNLRRNAVGVTPRGCGLVDRFRIHFSSF
jgi:hypothetical protein